MAVNFNQLDCVGGAGSEWSASTVGSMEQEYPQRCQQLGRLELDPNVPLHSRGYKHGARLARSRVLCRHLKLCTMGVELQLQRFHHWLVMLSYCTTVFLFFASYRFYTLFLIVNGNVMACHMLLRLLQ